MVVCGTREAVLRVKACRKEDESQKVSAPAWPLGIQGMPGSRYWNFSSQVTRREGEKKLKKKKIPRSPATPSRTNVVVYHISEPAGVAAGGHSSLAAKQRPQVQAVAKGSGDISNPGRVDGPECGLSSPVSGRPPAHRAQGPLFLRLILA